MATHRVEMRVELVMDEMDGSAEESALIALTLVEECLSEDLAGSLKVTVDSCEEVSDGYV